MRNNGIEIRPITPTIGATIRGVDLREPLDDAIFANIRTAFLDHQVIFFPDQAITPRQQVDFACRFGTIDEPHPVFRPHPDEPQVFIIEQRGKEGVYNDVWHTDVSYQACPPMASLLHAQIIPESGGDTLWASMTAAYEALSPRLKVMLESMTALHDFGHGYRDYLLGKPDGRTRLRAIEDQYPTVEHPVIRTHPDTGHRALFVNRVFTAKIVGLGDQESRYMLDLLFAHAEQPAFQLRYHWNVRDLAMWDNRCTQHNAVADFHPHHRQMHRITLRGDRPYFQR